MSTTGKNLTPGSVAVRRRRAVWMTRRTVERYLEQMRQQEVRW